MGLGDWVKGLFSAKDGALKKEQLGSQRVEFGITDMHPSAYASGIDPLVYSAYVRAAERGQFSQLVDLLLDIMRRDGHIRGVIDSRRLAVSGRKHSLIQAEADVDGIVYNATTKMLQRLSFNNYMNPGEQSLTFKDSLHDLTAANFLGLVAQEIIWKPYNGGMWPVELRWRPTQRFMVNTWNASLPLGEMRLKQFAGDSTGEALEPGKWILHRPRALPDWQQNQGYGYVIGWLWVLKSMPVRDWAILSELTGVPIRSAQYPKGTSNEVVDQLKDAMQSVGVDFFAVVPENTKLEFIQASHQGMNEFHKVFADWCDSQISKCVLGHSAGADATSGRLGGEDLAERVRDDLIASDATQLQQTIMRDLIAPFVIYNYGNIDLMPQFHIDISAPIDLDERSKVDVRLVREIGLKVESSYFYETYGIPAPREGEPLVVPPSDGGSEIVRSLRGKARSANHTFDAMISAALNDDNASKKADEEVTKMVNASVTRAIPVWEKWLSPLQKAITTADTFAEAESNVASLGASLNTTEMQELLSESQYASYALGRGQVARETDTNLASLGTVFAPLPEEDALDWLTSLTPITADEFYQYAADARTRSFTISGTQNELLIEGVRDRLAAAMARGDTFDTFKADYTNMVNAMGLTATNDYHLKTVFETNIATAQNVGRYNQQMDPDLADVFPYLQYRTVGDADVRPTHQAWNGLVFRSDHPFWLTHYPTNGMNCRCQAVLMTAEQVKARGLKVTEDASKLPLPDEGFETNPALAPSEV